MDIYDKMRRNEITLKNELFETRQKLRNARVKLRNANDRIRELQEASG